jgi:hypothetical protein
MNQSELMDALLRLQEREIKILQDVLDWAESVNLWVAYFDEKIKELENHGHPHDHPYHKPINEIVT